MPSTPSPEIPAERVRLRQEVAQDCAEVAPAILDELFTQLDDEYFTLFSAAHIAAHARLLAALDDDHPMHVRITPYGERRLEVLLVAYDLFGELSIITGLMAVYGLNIREGQVFSYRRGPERTTPWGSSTRGGLIIDVFTVEYPAAQRFDTAAQTAFLHQLLAYIQLARRGKLQEARAALNDRLMDTIRTSASAWLAPLTPVDIQIDNAASPEWTLVHIHADDTPGFLYSLSNALAMRDINVHRIRIHSVQGRVHDQLELSWRRGGKITSEVGQRELCFIVSLIKQFTHFLPVAPDPVMAMQHFDQFLDRLAADAARGADLRWLWDEHTLHALARVLGSSRFLWEDFLRLHYDTVLPVLKDLHTADRALSRAEVEAYVAQALAGATTPAARKQALNAVKDRELFRIDMRHLIHDDLPFGLFAEELTTLAEVIVAQALALAQEALAPRYGVPRLATGQLCTFALFGLGKLGGRELGYASDLEMLCVYTGQGKTDGPQRLEVSEYAELLIQHVLDGIVARRSGTFAIDLRLRPFGSKGPLASSHDAFCSYYRAPGPAAPFERQALIKLRWLAGDASLGAQIEAQRDAFVYAATPFDLQAAAALRQRQVQELVTPGTVDTKYSRGGLVEIEYTVQYLQLLHGHALPALRTPSTLPAIHALRQAQLLPQEEARALAAAYVFLRRLIDALRLVQGNAEDLVVPPTDANEFTFLARRMGYWQAPQSPTHLAQDMTQHMQQVARIYRAHLPAAALPC